MPFFSIILPTYNRAHLLPKAIESVIAQTFTDWELIVVDDGSTDNTKELIGSYSDPRIRYIYQTNQERSAARNKGIENAHGEYICFLDSDDYFLKDKLQNLATYFRSNNSKAKVIYDEICIENNETLNKIKSSEQSKYDTLFEFLIFNSLYSQQMCIAKEVLEIHKYNCRLHNNEDTELWLRISEHHDFSNLSDSFQTVIVEHTNRSINLLSKSQINNVLELYKFIFTATTPGSRASRKTKQKVFSKLYFNIAKIKMQQSKKNQAILWLLKSLMTNPRNELNKHILYCVKNLIWGKIPSQYQHKDK